MKASLFCAIVSLASSSSPVLEAQSLDSIQKMEASGDSHGRAHCARACRPIQSQQRACPYRLCGISGSLWRSRCARSLRKTSDRPAQWRRYRPRRRCCPPPSRARPAGRRSQRRALPISKSSARPAASPSPSARRPRRKLPAPGTATIPGPLRSFARMAALSPDSAPTTCCRRWRATSSPTATRPRTATKRWSRPNTSSSCTATFPRRANWKSWPAISKVIKIENCESPKAGELLRILGFRMRGGCGSEVVLETVNATRAFLTTDSGFPLNDLEQALRTNRPFTYDFHPTAVPVLFGPEYWMRPRRIRKAPNFIDDFISDPSICRLYLGFSKLDRETAEAMRKAVTPHPPEGLRARAGFLRRHVRNPRRQGRRSRRPARPPRSGPNWPAPRPIRAPPSSTS